MEKSDKTQGKLTATKTAILGTNVLLKDVLVSVNYYDEKGRSIQTISNNHEEGLERYSTQFNWAGEVVYTTHSHNQIYQEPITSHTKYQYDHAGRLYTTTHRLERLKTPGEENLLAANKYDELGRLTTKFTGGKLKNGYFNAYLRTNYKFNIRGWLTDINNPNDDTPSGNYFAMKLYYNDCTGLDGLDLAPQYNGNIAATTWRSGSSYIHKGYGYKYDALNRIINADFGEKQPTGEWAYTHQGAGYDINAGYDLNGNITTLNRESLDLGTYSYFENSNKIKSVNDRYGSYSGMNSSWDYTYDPNGNLKSRIVRSITPGDNGAIIEDKQHTIVYNCLNLPHKIYIDNDSITYTYDASGRKLKRVLNQHEDYADYFGEFVYDKGSHYVLTGEGRILLSDDSELYEYHVKDHLGNTRLVVADRDNSGFLNEADLGTISDYYPFGLRHEPVHNEDANQKYLYNGKELQNETGWYDYGARMYDPELGRWHVPDPMAIDYYSLSPYSYVANNPLKYIDPEGMWITAVVIGEDEEGNRTATLVAIQEEGDDLTSLAEFLDINEDETKETYGSYFNEDEADDSPFIAVQGEFADAVNDAFTHALNNPDEYEAGLGTLFGLGIDENYNCYESAISIAKGENIDKDNVMSERELNKDLNDNFNVAGDDEKQYGKTVVLYGYSKASPMHATVFLGTDKEGNSYYFSKGGKINAPKIVKAKDPNNIKSFTGYGDVQNNYNSK